MNHLRRNLYRMAAAWAACLLAVANAGDGGRTGEGGLPDDTTALTRSVESLAAGDTLSLGNRTFVIRSETLGRYANRAINVPHDNVTVRDGTIVVSGAAPCGVFHSHRNGTTFRNVRFIGNNVNGTGTTLGYGTAIVFNNPGDGELRDFTVDNCSFRDFKGMGWVWANVAGTGGIRGIRFTNNRAEGGGAYRIADSGTSSAPFFVGTSGTGTIRDVTVSGNFLHAARMKGGIHVIGNGGTISRVTVTGNVIRDMAAAYGAAVVNGYGITLKPGVREFSVRGNDVSAYTAGIYAVQANDGEITGNRVSDQAERDDQVIYRGGIVFGGDNIVVSGNAIDNCFYGIQGQMGSSDARVVIADNRISTTGGPGIKIGFQPGFVTGGLRIFGNDVRSAAGGGIRFLPHPRDKTHRVRISGNRIYAGGSYGISVSGILTSDDWEIAENNITSKDIGISLDANGANRITIASNQVVAIDHTARYGIKATNNDTTGATPWRLLNNSVFDVTNPSGAAYYTYAVTGSLEGNRAIRCTRTVYDGLGKYRLGIDTPWWTINAAEGTFVQRLTDAARGEVGAETYDGWIFENSAWNRRRVVPGARQGPFLQKEMSDPP